MNRTLLLVVVLLAAAAAVHAQFKAPAIDGSADLKKNLQIFQTSGSKVQVSLKAGRVIIGSVVGVGRDFFLMDKLDEGADRMALVRQDDVSVITYQAR